MSRTVVISVRMDDGRYHGAGPWPPSPARLFQALVAGAGVSGPLEKVDLDALNWLEERDPPLIVSPRMSVGQSFIAHVPHNDLDTKGGDPRNLGSIRAAKAIMPRLFDAAVSFLYAWSFDDDPKSERQALAVCALAARLYQFGCGVDMAWACGEILGEDELQARLSEHPGIVSRPSRGGVGHDLPCPAPGSLASLEQRHAARARRFQPDKDERGGRVQLFTQPPKARFVEIPYERPPVRQIYELCAASGDDSFVIWPLAQSYALVVLLRDRVAERLRRALPRRRADIERFLIGRKSNGDDDAPISSRVRIVPLPSIGHHYADRGIRRVLLEIPSDCPLRADDIHLAFSGLELKGHNKSGEHLNLLLRPAQDRSILARYDGGVAGPIGARVWRTVTAAALPESSHRRSLANEMGRAKNGTLRANVEAAREADVLRALRYVGVRARVVAVRTQREPFEGKGACADEFADGARFAKGRLRHVEITFDEPVAGPLVLGDGRFLGLGVMAPVQRSQGVHVFAIESGLATNPHTIELTRALRRAVMARVQGASGPHARLPSFFTGHGDDGSPAGEKDPHLTFLFDREATRLVIVAPHVVDRRPPRSDEIANLALLNAALTGFRELRAGTSGLLKLRATSVDVDSDHLFAASQVWESVTSYHVTRHSKHGAATETLSTDLRTECRRRGLPEPSVMPLQLRGVAGVGLLGTVRLTFDVAVPGPISLGRSRHFGGGLFAKGESVAAASANRIRRVDSPRVQTDPRHA